MTGEQLSAGFDSLARQLATWVQSIPVRMLQRGLMALMALWIIYGIAQFVGALMPIALPDSDAAPTESGGALVQQSSRVDIEALQALNLFGLAGEVPAPDAAATVTVDEEALNAEKTRLNLVLEGIVYSSNPQESAAVIVHQGKQESFYVGDRIPGGNQVTLAKVLLDRVILENNGNYEALWLYDDSQSSAGSAPSRAARPAASGNRVADMRSNASVTSMAQNYRDRVFNNPSSLAQVIRITPETQNGEMVGYRISPGRDSEQFKKLGLQPNDVVTRINDIALNEPSNALEVYKLMRTATEASFSIERGGETVEIRVSLGDQ